MSYTDHTLITSAGWTYRMNDRGWVIYRDPRTGIWYTRAEAMAIIAAAAPAAGSARTKISLDLDDFQFQPIA